MSGLDFFSISTARVCRDESFPTTSMPGWNISASRLVLAAPAIRRLGTFPHRLTNCMQCRGIGRMVSYPACEPGTFKGVIGPESCMLCEKISQQLGASGSMLNCVAGKYLRREGTPAPCDCSTGSLRAAGAIAAMAAGMPVVACKRRDVACAMLDIFIG